MVDMVDPYAVWDEYKFLEEDFIDYLRYVPLAKDHYNVWSLYLGDLLLRTGSILDSFLRRSIFSSVLDGVNYIDAKRKGEINIETYRDIFEPFYQLSSKNIYELRTFKRLTPFFLWKYSESPSWWKA